VPVDGDPDAKKKTIEAADAHAASVLFDAAIRSAPGLADRIDRGATEFRAYEPSGRARRREIAGRGRA